MVKKSMISLDFDNILINHNIAPFCITSDKKKQ